VRRACPQAGRGAGQRLEIDMRGQIGSAGFGEGIGRRMAAQRLEGVARLRQSP
jgi:hypothetical protein